MEEHFKTENHNDLIHYMTNQGQPGRYTNNMKFNFNQIHKEHLLKK